METTIPAKPDVEDTVTRHDIVEIQSAGKKLVWKPETESASQTLGALTKDIPFRREVWYLEFTFKPLRMIDVDMPRPDGRMDRRQIWYMVYRVKNLGQHLDANAELGKDGAAASNAGAGAVVMLRLTREPMVPRHLLVRRRKFSSIRSSCSRVSR